MPNTLVLMCLETIDVAATDMAVAPKPGARSRIDAMAGAMQACAWLEEEAASQGCPQIVRNLETALRQLLRAAPEARTERYLNYQDALDSVRLLLA